MQARTPHAAGGDTVLRYLSILKAARDFGVNQEDIEAVAGTFDRRRPRCDQLAEALADLALAGGAQAPPEGRMFWLSRNRLSGS